MSPSHAECDTASSSRRATLDEADTLRRGGPFTAISSHARRAPGWCFSARRGPDLRRHPAAGFRVSASSGIPRSGLGNFTWTCGTLPRVRRRRRCCPHPRAVCKASMDAAAADVCRLDVSTQGHPLHRPPRRATRECCQILKSVRQADRPARSGVRTARSGHILSNFKNSPSGHCERAVRRTAQGTPTADARARHHIMKSDVHAGSLRGPCRAAEAVCDQAGIRIFRMHRQETAVLYRHASLPRVRRPRRRHAKYCARRHQQRDCSAVKC